MAQSSNLVQKCDARHPCTTCTLADSTSACIYDDEEGPQWGGIVPSLSSDDPILGQLLGKVDAAEIPTTMPTHLAAPLGPTPSTDTTRMMADEPPDLWVFMVGRVPPGPSSGFVLVPGNSFGRRISLDSNPSISIASSFIPPTIPPEPWISLSFL